MKLFVEWKCVAFILSEEISDDVDFSKEYKLKFARNGAGSVSIGMPIDCFISSIKIAFFFF